MEMDEAAASLAVATTTTTPAQKVAAAAAAALTLNMKGDASASAVAAAAAENGRATPPPPANQLAATKSASKHSLAAEKSAVGELAFRAIADVDDADNSQSMELDEENFAALDGATDTDDLEEMDGDAEVIDEFPPVHKSAAATKRRRTSPAQSPLPSDGDGKNHAATSSSTSKLSTEGGGSSSQKRKRYEVRRSGSEECLLGFDEQSGEAELVRGGDEEENLIQASAGSGPSKMSFAGKVHGSTRASASPPTAKKMRQSVPSPTVRSSPKRFAKSPGHVVAADDITNGATTNKSANSSTPNPASKTSRPTLAHHPAVAGTASTGGGGGSSSSSLNKKTAQPATAASLLPANDEFYRKPFEFGWRRELVWRANLETSKDKADVYFISPAGKKLRTRTDILPLLEGDLTIDHFNFSREPLGAPAEHETVRSAKPSSRISIAAATLAAAPPTPPAMGKRVSKPKGPKGASPPPQGWTPTRALKVNNAALLSSSNRHSGGGGSSGGGGGGGSSGGGGGSSNANTTPTSARSAASSSVLGSASKHSKAAKKPSTTTSTPTGAGGSNQPCNATCTRAPGRVPQLLCAKCLCLFHHECVGLHRNAGAGVDRNYICENCQPISNTKIPPSGQTTKPIVSARRKSTSPQQQQQQQHNAHKSATPVNASKAHKTTSTSQLAASTAATTTTAAISASPRPAKKFPQTIAVVKGKKYVMVAKPNVVVKRTAAAYANDIENDLKQINESIRKSAGAATNRKGPVVAQPESTAVAQLNNAASTNSGDQSNKVFATNFFANVSFAFDALLCILKYLKIHERPRAASVCKLWHLAAKDTSLWHTVRMKNSKVCNWAGFTAALRRGETKHLDLRKMLWASATRPSDEMWQEFSEHIGTVCSLEVIDLCRCPARVVEQLFQSNRGLRVLNAIAINDDTLRLEHVGHLQRLEELRLRTCEPAVLVGDLQPLQALTQLVHLSLTAIRGLGAASAAATAAGLTPVAGLHVLGELQQLRSLELGECGDFEDSFAVEVLPRLLNLQRLRLENGQETACCTLAILEAVAKLPLLAQLELVNFDIKPGFDERMQVCRQVRKLLIIPTYISQSATTNHIVLSAVQQVADTLSVFTWGVTVELLRVTALYVDQCEESTKKEKHHFDECIPVLKPVPGAPPNTDETAAGDDEEEQPPSHDGDDDEESARHKKRQQEKERERRKEQQERQHGEEGGTATTGGGGVSAAAAVPDVPQIEILPLDKVESILADNLPNTKFTIVKVPYHATCKQQLVE